jgi:hypothetical protein
MKMPLFVLSNHGFASCCLPFEWPHPSHYKALICFGGDRHWFTEGSFLRFRARTLSVKVVSTGVRKVIAEKSLRRALGTGGGRGIRTPDTLSGIRG